jgi:hypothetical protein
MLVGGAALLVFFVLWTALTWRPVFVTYNSKYSIFSRHYRQHGVLGSRFIAYYNFALTVPPSTPSVSHPPLVPLIMHAASLLGQDRPPTYYAVIIAFHVAAFVLLGYFVRRRWGETAALWTLVLVVLNRYALTYGDQQTSEPLGVVGSLAAIFLYFEWLETGKARLILLSVGAYLVGLAADYLTVFAGLTMCAHWLVFVRGKGRRDWLLMTLVPIVTMTFAGLMLALMREAGIPLGAVLGRAAWRSSANAPNAVFRAYAEYPLRFLGPVMVSASVAFVGYLLLNPRRRNDSPVDRTRQLLCCLAAPGILAVTVFGQSFLHHRFLTLYLLPFFAVSAGLGLARLWRAWSSPELKRWGSVGIVGVALLSSLPGNARLATLHWRSDPTAEARSPYRRLQRLAEQIGPQVREGDRLLILNGARYSESEKITVFYELWIPCVDGGDPARWDGLLATGSYRLMLATDATALQWLRSRPDIRFLAGEDRIAFFEARED